MGARLCVLILCWPEVLHLSEFYISIVLQLSKQKMCSVPGGKLFRENFHGHVFHHLEFISAETHFTETPLVYACTQGCTLRPTHRRRQPHTTVTTASHMLQTCMMFPCIILPAGHLRLLTPHEHPPFHMC